MEATQTPISRGMKRDVVYKHLYVYRYIYTHTQWTITQPFAEMQMDPHTITPSEVRESKTNTV